MGTSVLPMKAWTNNGATDPPNANVKCMACMYGPESRPQSSRHRTLAPVSKNPPPIPIREDETISIQRCLHQGIAPMPIAMAVMTIKRRE